MEEIKVVLESWYMFDMWVFSQWWTYVFVIPIVLYIPFFAAKWFLLTLPLWLPINLVVSNIFKDRGPKPKRPF